MTGRKQRRRREPITGMTRKAWQEMTHGGRINFTCEHCGKDVPWGRFKGQDKPRNHCPYCLWSKHVSMDIGGYPPCGAMIRGVDVSGDGSEVVWRCLGCGYMMRGPTDDYMLRTIGRFDYTATVQPYGALIEEDE